MTDKPKPPMRGLGAVGVFTTPRRAPGVLFKGVDPITASRPAGQSRLMQPLLADLRDALAGWEEATAAAADLERIAAIRKRWGIGVQSDDTNEPEPDPNLG